MVEQVNSGIEVQSSENLLPGDRKRRKPEQVSKRKDQRSALTPIEIPIIAISGRERVGKDLLCEKLHFHLLNRGLKPWRRAFADGIRDILYSIYRDFRFYELNKEKEVYQSDLGGSIRDLLIGVGEGLKETLGEYIWVRALIEKYNAEVKNEFIEEGKSVLIIPDLRFAPEYRWLDKCPKVYQIFITRGCEEDINQEIETLQESKLGRKIDRIIKNTRSKIQLSEEAEKIVSELITKWELKVTAMMPWEGQKKEPKEIDEDEMD